MVKMKTSLYVMFAISAIFLGGLCIMLTSANPTSDLKAKLQAMDRLFSQKLLDDRAVLSRQPSSLVRRREKLKQPISGRERSKLELHVMSLLKQRMIGRP